MCFLIFFRTHLFYWSPWYKKLISYTMIGALLKWPKCRLKSLEHPVRKYNMMGRIITKYK